MPYSATLERDAGGCKIVVDGSCASQRLSQRLYYISISIKLQRFKGERNLPRILAFETLASLNPSPCRNFTESRRRREEEEERKKEEEEERKKEEDGASPELCSAEIRFVKGGR